MPRAAAPRPRSPRCAAATSLSVRRRCLREPGPEPVSTRGNIAGALDFPTQEIASAVRADSSSTTTFSSSRGLLRMIRTAADLDSHWNSWSRRSTRLPIGYILAMEGADPIVDVGQAADWWDWGLRSVNLAHYGKSRYAVGTGDDGPLTTDGISLLEEFEQLGMILDATHLSDTSFFQALDRFSGPVLASHNNCRALVPDGRQFSDHQIQLADRPRRRDRGCARRLDALTGLDQGSVIARFGAASRRSPTILTISASLPATRVTRRSAATWMADSAPSRLRLAWTGSPISRSSMYLAVARLCERGDRRDFPRQLAAILPAQSTAMNLARTRRNADDSDVRLESSVARRFSADAGIASHREGARLSG